MLLPCFNFFTLLAIITKPYIFSTLIAFCRCFNFIIQFITYETFELSLLLSIKQAITILLSHIIMAIIFILSIFYFCFSGRLILCLMTVTLTIMLEQIVNQQATTDPLQIWIQLISKSLFTYYTHFFVLVFKAKSDDDILWFYLTWPWKKLFEKGIYTYTNWKLLYDRSCKMQDQSRHMYLQIQLVGTQQYEIGSSNNLI